MDKSAILAILSGRKTIETRFSKHKIAPFGQVNTGDLVYMKVPGGEVVGQFRIKKVFYFAGLTQNDVEKIFKEYGEQILRGDQKLDLQYQSDKKDSNFGTLIFIEQSEQFITSPIKIKKSDQRGWMVLG